MRYSLGYNGQFYVEGDLRLLGGEGRVQPRLVIDLTAETPLRQGDLFVEQLRMRLKLDRELLGEGSIRDIGADLYPRAKRNINVDVFIAREAIPFIQEHFRGHELFLDADLDALLRLRREPSAGWEFVPVRSHGARFRVSRSDWVKTVLEPLGFGKYMLLEVRVPDVPERERWAKSLDHLKAAEEQYAIGNAAGVFSHCRAAFEEGALEGAPKNVFDHIADPHKRHKLDELLAKTTSYFHAGRHVSKSGPQQGEFPVDYQDAEFALGVAKLWMAYIAKLLAETT